MNCREVEIYIDEYITGRLNSDESSILEEHLNVCEKCRRRLAQDRDMIGLLKTDKIPDPGEKYWADMENSVLSRIAEKPERPIIPEEPKGAGFLLNLLVPLAAVLVFFLIADSDYIYDINKLGKMETVQIAAKGPSDMIGTFSINLPKTRLISSILMTVPGSAGSQGLIIGHQDNRSERN